MPEPAKIQAWFRVLACLGRATMGGPEIGGAAHRCDAGSPNIGMPSSHRAAYQCKVRSLPHPLCCSSITDTVRSRLYLACVKSRRPWAVGDEGRKGTFRNRPAEVREAHELSILVIIVEVPWWPTYARGFSPCRGSFFVFDRRMADSHTSVCKFFTHVWSGRGRSSRSIVW